MGARPVVDFLVDRDRFVALDQASFKLELVQLNDPSIYGWMP